MGLEPTTARLRAARSTDWARKATDDTLNISLFYQYLPPIYRDTYPDSLLLWYLPTSLCAHLDVCLLSYIPTYSLYLYHPLSSTSCCYSPAFCPLFTLYLSCALSNFPPFCFYLPCFYFPWFVPLFPSFCPTRPILFCLPLILFLYFSLGSFRGSVGRAIGC